MRMRAVFFSLLFVGALQPPAPAAAQASRPEAASSGDAADVIVRVGERRITADEYRQALAVATRRKYYHAKPPEGELGRFQREVADDMANRILLLAEARRRGIEPDRARIDNALAQYSERYKGNKAFEANRAKMLPVVRAQMEEDSLLQRLEAQVRSIREPSAKEARTFYDKNRQLFVEPEQVRLHVILLRVDPGAPTAAWQAALAEGEQIHQRIVRGADFADLAKLHSADPSAAKGGDMGYVHRGMLPEPVHGVIDQLKPGETAKPVRVLEGISVLRLEDRKAAKQRGFEEVQERAGDLWQREEGESAWTSLIAELRKRTPVRIDEARLQAAAAKVRTS